MTVELTAQFSSAASLTAEFGSSPDLEIRSSFGQMVPDLTVESFSTLWSEGAMPSSVYHVIAASGNNAASIKAVAGTVTGWTVYNNTDETIYVKLYDTVVVPNPASLVPRQVIAITAGLSSVCPPGIGLAYLNGIGIAIVQGIADDDSAPVSASSCCVDIFYQ